MTPRLRTGGRARPLAGRPRSGLALMLVLATVGPVPAWAQASGGIQIVAPTLPPRQGGAGARQGGAGTPQGGAAAGQARPGEAGAAVGVAPQVGATHGGAGQGAAGWSNSRSPQPGAGYYPQADSPYAAAPSPAAPLSAQRSQGGACQVELPPDRRGFSLHGSDSLARRHVALGDFRARQVVRSADGRWAVVMIELRARSQFAVMTIDLVRCEVGATHPTAAAASDARFDGEFAVVAIEGTEQRLRLAERGSR